MVFLFSWGGLDDFHLASLPASTLIFLYYLLFELQLLLGDEDRLGGLRVDLALPEEGAVVDVGVFEELFSVFVELVFSDLVAHLEYFAIKESLPALGQELVEEASSGL